MNGRKLSAILFLAIIISIPLISLIFSKNKTDFPKNILNQEYSYVLENFMQNELIFKKQINTLKTYIELISGKQEIQGVYITKSHMLENLDDINYSNISQKIEHIKNIGENSNVPVNFMLIPSSLEIYKDKSLSLSPIPSQKNIIENIYKTTGEKISKVDVLTALNSAKSQYIYYKTDSHLTSLGSYYCYNELMKSQNEIPINISQFNIQHASYDFYGSIYNKVSLNNLGSDRIDLYYYPDGAKNFEVIKYSNNEMSQKYNDIFFKQQLTDQNKYNVFLGEDYPITKIKTNVKNGKKLLLFKDSFANSMVQFLVNNYEEIVLVDFYNLDFEIEDYINIYEFNQISFVFGIQKFI